MSEISEIMQSPAIGGVVLAFCLAALKWMDKDRSEILVNLHKEREQRIIALEGRTKACEEDRIQLHVQMAQVQKAHNDLQTEIRHMMTSMLRSSTSGECSAGCLKENK